MESRVYQKANDQPVFRQAKVYTPTAQATQAVNNEFTNTVDQRLQNIYTDLSNQYEARKLTDQGFADQMQQAIDSAPDQTVQQKWAPVLTQVKYTVFSNAQALEDLKIQSDVSSGKISEVQAADRYKALSAAAIAQDSQSAIRDSATWDLKANQYIAASKRGSGSGSGTKPISAKDLFDVQSAFDQMDYLRKDAQDNEATATAALNDPNTFVGLSKTDADNLRQALTKSISDGWDTYYSSTEKFANSDLYYNFYNENPDIARSKLNDNLDAIHAQGSNIYVPPAYGAGRRPTVIPGSGTYTPGQTDYKGNDVGSTINNMIGETTYGNSTSSNSAPAGPPPPENISVPIVAPQTNYQANPLGL